MAETTAANEKAEGAPQELSLRVLLYEMIQKGASDLHLTVGERPKLRVDGDLVNSSFPRPLAPKDTLALAYSILTEAQKKRFELEDELDFSFGVQNLSRFRGNVYKQRGCVAMAIRQIPYEIQSAEKLGLPPDTEITPTPAPEPGPTGGTVPDVPADGGTTLGDPPPAPPPSTPPSTPPAPPPSTPSS